MDEAQLLRLLKQDEAAATSYHESELAKNQEEALKRYFGELYGSEVEGRSQVVTNDLEDTINWIMPDLMRAFTASDDLVSCVAKKPDDDAGTHVGQINQARSKSDVMAAYLSHVFFEDNDGQTAIHDFAFDGLLQRLGVMHVGWEDPQRGPPQLIEGVGAAQLQKYLEDDEYEITGADEDGETFVIEVRRTPKHGRAVVEAVPPEEFALERAAKSIEASHYHRRKQLAWRSELVKRYPDKKDDLEEARTALSDSSPTSDARMQARHSGESVDDSARSLEKGREQVWLLTEYMRIDYDEDGTVELRQIKRVGDVILENMEVGESEFVTWTPSRVSHKAVGRSMFDMLKDIQKIRTVVTRAWLDGLSQSVTARTYIDKNSIDNDGIDTILNNEYGGVVLCKGDVSRAVREVVTADVSGPCVTALEYFDQRAAESSGVTKHSQGMDPAALNKTATGIDLLQAAAKTRIEMIARWLGDALEDVFKLVLKKLVHHQDGARLVKLFGEWIEVDPRTWSDEMVVKIDVGSAGVSKQQRIANLMLIAGKQEQVLMQAGAGNPLVTLQHYRATLAALTGDMGFPDPTLFWGEIPQDWQAPPQSDPKAEEASGRLQLETAKAQADMQIQAQKMAHERELAMLKAQSDRQLAEIRIASETQIAREKMAAEMQLAREKAEMEAELAERDSVRRASVTDAAARQKMSNGVRFGGEVG